MTKSEQFDPRPRFLMCRPQHFAVTYSINPWMDPAAWHESGDALHATADAAMAGPLPRAPRRRRQRRTGRAAGRLA